jgi:hypothetical protein
MQANYRAIFIEMLNAQAAATAAIVDVGVRCAELMRQECQAALLTLVKETRLGNGGVGPAQPSGKSGTTAVFSPGLADFCRAFAGLPRLSMMSFLSQYDDLRGRRPVVRD